jgi:hypothetical protein
MELSNLDSNINSKIIQPKGGTFFRSPEGYMALNMLTIQNARICLVDSENFYSCYVSPQRNCAGSLYTDVDVISINNKEINAPKGKGQLAKQIIKFENNKFCFIPMHSGFWTSLGCDAAKISLDNDCVSDIIREIPVCGKKIEPEILSDSDKKAIVEFDKFSDFLNNLGQYNKFCKKNFFFNTNNIVSGYYIYANPNGQLDLRLNKDGGKVIKRNNFQFIPYEPISDETSTKTYFGNYDSLKNTFIISPSGDYSTSDKSIINVQDTSIVAVSNENNKWILTSSNPYIMRQRACT